MEFETLRPGIASVFADIDIDRVLIEINPNTLVICHPTGIFYTAQTRGVCCNHPEAEGFMLPVEFEESEEFNRWFDCKHNCYKKWENGSEEQMKSASLSNRFIQGAIKMSYKYQINSMLFDFERIKDFQEGWWPVKGEGYLHYLSNRIKGIQLKQYKGYLHLGNCD